jgi:hypothetical protein
MWPEYDDGHTKTSLLNHFKELLCGMRSLTAILPQTCMLFPLLMLSRQTQTTVPGLQGKPTMPIIDFFP